MRKLQKLNIINEGRLVDYEMSHLLGGATSCPMTYSDNEPTCHIHDEVCINQKNSCVVRYSNCSTPHSYSVCSEKYNAGNLFKSKRSLTIFIPICGAIGAL
jgi:hypothetical protein